MRQIAVLSFPLRGEWKAGNSPSDQVPSHGTDFFAQRYAIDFFRVDEQTGHPHSSSVWKQLLAWVPADDFHCWGASVLAAANGVVRDVGDGWPDRRRVNLLYELMRATIFPPSASASEFRPLAGNYVILETPHGYLLYAHLQAGSIKVRVGDQVEVNDEIARVGNSGNTTMPHLHFQRMSHPDPFEADGLPILFSGLETNDSGEWVDSEPILPAKDDRFRSRATAGL